MKNTRKQAKKQPLRKQMKKMSIKTPFADAGKIAGNAIGGMFGNSQLGKGVGKWLGSGIGQIFGSGDYQITGQSPSYNVIANGSQIPKFSTERQTNIVCHREYLGDIVGTAAFNNKQYPLNPGVAQTFPWLATVAQNYQEYKFHGLVFEFRSLITDFVTGGTPGVVVMATNYNSGDVSYTTKQQMENSEYAVSTKPTINLMHGVECADHLTVMSKQYVRTGPVPAGQDVKTFDLGLFQFATQNNPVQNLGELWVSYCVEFFKPILSDDVGGDTLSSRSYRTNVSSSSPLGLVQFSNVGDLNIDITATNISWLGFPGQEYILTFYWVGTATAITHPGNGLVGLSGVNVYNSSTTSLETAPANGTISSSQIYNVIVSCTLLSPGNVTWAFNTAGVFPISAAVDITVTQVSNRIGT